MSQTAVVYVLILYFEGIKVHREIHTTFVQKLNLKMAEFPSGLPEPCDVTKTVAVLSNNSSPAHTDLQPRLAGITFTEI